MSLLAECAVCGSAIIRDATPSKSQPRKYCSLKCRQAASRRQLRESYTRLRPARLAGSLAYQAAHRDEILMQRRERRQRDGLKHRRRDAKARLMSKYGLTLEQFDAMNDAQAGLCAICHLPERRKNRDGSPQPLSVDHDHTTGQVRGLLCARCNSVLGWIETPGQLDAALDYLALAEGQRERTALG